VTRDAVALCAVFVEFFSTVGMWWLGLGLLIVESGAELEVVLVCVVVRRRSVGP